jgi:hypothetical protein
MSPFVAPESKTVPRLQRSAATLPPTTDSRRRPARAGGGASAGPVTQTPNNGVERSCFCCARPRDHFAHRCVRRCSYRASHPHVLRCQTGHRPHGRTIAAPTDNEPCQLYRCRGSSASGELVAHDRQIQHVSISRSQPHDRCVSRRPIPERPSYDGVFAAPADGDGAWFGIARRSRLATVAHSQRWVVGVWVGSRSDLICQCWTIFCGDAASGRCAIRSRSD